MKLGEFDIWAKSLLEFHETDAIDSAMNGIQVGNLDAEIEKMAFAVDACLASFVRTKEENAQALFVHHGIFWGSAQPLTGVHGERIRYLMKNDIALYACHLPLDRHAELGNNIKIAETLNLENIEPFGSYKGKQIGYKGVLPETMDIQSIIVRLFGAWENRISALRFGTPKIRSVAVVSGGAVREVSQAIDEGLDLYITGDASHNIYHECQEARINVLFAGHYLTEIFGVQAMAERIKRELGIETTFIDIPTGY